MFIFNSIQIVHAKDSHVQMCFSLHVNEVIFSLNQYNALLFSIE